METSRKSAEALPESATGRRASVSTFRALKHRHFRVLWIGLSVSAVGTWIQIVAQSLLVLDLTGGSAAALGVVSLSQALAFLLLAPLGGSAADRYDKRRLLLLTQSLLMGLAFLLGVLTATGVIRFWMIPALAFASSATLAFDQPTRNALIPSLVPKEDLINAVALQSAVFNGASILGPASAGLALSRIGYSGNFFLNAASYTAVVVALLVLRFPAPGARSTHGGGWLESIREITRYVGRDALLPAAVLAYGTLLFFGPSAAVILPFFARQVLQASPEQLGMLFSAMGIGTVFGSLVVTSLGDFPRKGRLVLVSILIWIVALAAFGLSDNLYASAPALFVMGAAQNAAGATTITLLQMRVPPEVRGRAMSLNTLLIMCVRPLGDFPVAAVLGVIGFEPTILLSAAIVAVVLFTLSVVRPAFRTA